MQPKLQFQTARAVFEHANLEMLEIAQVDLFNDSQYQKLTEQWCAGMFGLGYEKFIRPCLVAINIGNDRLDADFFLRTDNQDFAFQVVEVQDPSRRRGAEYRLLAEGKALTFPYEPEKGHIEGPTWIVNAIEKKVRKNYAGATDLNLLVYANFTARKLDHDVLVAATEPYAKSFASIWVVTNLHLSYLWGTDELGRIDGWGIIIRPEDYEPRRP
jgi:hypothetical protein